MRGPSRYRRDANAMRYRRTSHAAWFAGALAFVSFWAIALILTASTLEKHDRAGLRLHHPEGATPAHEEAGTVNRQRTTAGDEDDVAQPIPGIALQIPPPNANDPPIQLVYANDTATSPSRSKGVALLLHACSHSAYKFFSPSSTCPECVGLSEELRIVRLVVERGYFPLAVSSVERKRGCWSNGRDGPRIEAVLHHDLFRDYGRGKPIFGIGASSGGAFAAYLATIDVVQGATVMVMSLTDKVVTKLRQDPKPIYLAPMPRDTGTMKRALQNYRDLEGVKEYIVMDRTTCASLPLTTEYLVQRVVGMTPTDANSLISQLKHAGHLDSKSNLLRVDPTRNEWKLIVSRNNSTHWLGRYALKPGYSPLAKALHRAWAMHEYCSEAVGPALAFFEERLKKRG